MSNFFSHLSLHHILAVAGLAAAPYLVATLAFLCFMIFLKYAAANKSDREYALIALRLVQANLGVKLGTKADAVIALFLDGLNLFPTGKLTKQQMVDEYVKFIATGTSVYHVELTPVEVAAVRDAASVVVDMIDVKNAPTAAAVKQLSQEATVRAMTVRAASVSSPVTTSVTNTIASVRRDSF